MGRYGLATVCFASALLVASVAGALVGPAAGVAAPNHGGSNTAVAQGGQSVTEFRPPGVGSLNGPGDDDHDHWNLGAHGTRSGQRTWISQQIARTVRDRPDPSIRLDRVGDRRATVRVRGEPERGSQTFDASDTGGPTPGPGLVVGGGLTIVLAALAVGSQL